MQLVLEKRGSVDNTETIDDMRVMLTCTVPLAEILVDFNDKLKSMTRGYGSMDYEYAGYQAAKLIKMDMLIAGEPVDAFSMIVHQDKAASRGRELAERLKNVIPRQLFTVAIQACIGGKIIARESISPVLGIVAGYFGKAVDTIIMRICDVFLAIPNLILAIAIMAVLGSKISNLIAVLVFSGWVNYCKVIRNNVRVIKNQEFIHASRVLGAGHLHIMFRQIFPNVTTNLIIIGSQKVGQTILVEAALSFLSLGIQPPTPSWGNMISNGRTFLMVNPWLVLVPGIALMLTVLAFNFLGDGLRDVLDPKRIS